MRAVVFDFFGTLTDPAAEAERHDVFTATAGALGIAAPQFWAVARGCFDERMTGVLGDAPTMLRELARRCGIRPTDRQVADAVAVHRSGSARIRRPRPGVLAALDTLRAAGFRLAVLSDCGSELCDGWDATVFASRIDATVFSWQEGYRKPDPRLYATAASRLGVVTTECWYIGDGGSREHQGARSAGMRPVLVTNAGFPGVAGYRHDPDPHVPDVAVDDIAEVPALVGRATPHESGDGAATRPARRPSPGRPPVDSRG